MAAKDRSAKRRRYGWTTPRYRDKAFLAAVVITVGLVVLQAVMVTDHFTPIWYLNVGVRAVITWIIISAVIRIRVGIQRGLVGGFRESQEAAAAKPTESKADTIAQTSGRTVGRAIAAYKKSQSKPPT